MPQDMTGPGTGGVEAALGFILPQEQKPSYHSAAYTGGEPEIFFEVEHRVVRIADVRQKTTPPEFECEGFEFLARPTMLNDFKDDAAVQDLYYPEIEALLKERFAASHVVIFDSTRRSDGGQGAENLDGARLPAPRVHVDYTPKSGPQRLKDSVGESQGERLLESGSRIIQVNVWRPTVGPVQRAPLALADASSIKKADLIATDQVFPARVGEIYHLTHSLNHRWYFASEMERDEVFLIKGWDSADPEGSHFAPHGAFQLPNQDPAAPPRESIEVRTFIIID